MLRTILSAKTIAPVSKNTGDKNRCGRTTVPPNEATKRRANGDHFRRRKSVRGVGKS
jgi:hypothetical protein